MFSTSPLHIWRGSSLELNSPSSGSLMVINLHKGCQHYSHDNFSHCCAVYLCWLNAECQPNGCLSHSGEHLTLWTLHDLYDGLRLLPKIKFYYECHHFPVCISRACMRPSIFTLKSWFPTWLKDCTLYISMTCSIPQSHFFVTQLRSGTRSNPVRLKFYYVRIGVDARQCILYRF